MAYAYPPQPVYATRSTAPVSLHVVAIFQYLGGLAMLAIAALFGFAASDFLAQWGDQFGTRTSTATPVIAFVVGVFATVGLIAIVLGRKVQRGRNWARILLNVLNLLTIASVLYADLRSLHDGRSLTGLILPVLCLILLNTRAARSWFHAHTY